MAKKENRIIITLRSTESAHTYTTTKNKVNDPGRVEFNKYDPVVRRVCRYKESK
jgi:large subunit ribosomal protein L33